MVDVDWDERAVSGGLQSVIDPADRAGLKSGLIDRIQWDSIRNWAGTRHSVLDFGCGIGRFAQRLTQGGVAYCGVDTSAAMIDAARRLQSDGRARFFNAGLPLPFEDGSFDGCLTVWVLQYLRSSNSVRLRDTVAELARVLSPGGELLMIEQASASGGKSGSVGESSSEQNYLDVLSGHFGVVDLQRLRCGTLSRLSSLYLRFGADLPMRDRLEGLLARHESERARLADSNFLRTLAYYDVAVLARKHAES